MTRLRHLAIRPSPAPGVPLPLAGRSVGHYRFRPGETDGVRRIPYLQVYWGVAGSGRQRLGRRELDIPPEHVACCPPGRLRRVAAGDAWWEYRWWTVDGPWAASVAMDFGIRPGRPRRAGPAPVSRFRALEAAIRDPTPAGERRAAAIAFELLALAAGRREPDPDRDATDPTATARRVLTAEWPDPELDVGGLARRLGVHRSLLARRFRRRYGVSPSAYLADLRNQAALVRLETGDEPIAAVARACGWRDPNYFSRCITRLTGLSPRAYRRGRSG